MRIVLALLGAMASFNAQELLVCGWDEVYILNIERGQAAEKVFMWRAEDSPEMPPNYRSAFRTTSECKPLPQGRILVTSSADGVAILERETGKALFWAMVPSAHSAEMLPGNKVVVAGSVKQGGNRLAVFDATVPEKEISSVEFFSAHGVVWEESRKLLWAVGGPFLRSYRWEDPKLELEAEYRLPEDGGHDLYAVDRGSRVGLSTEDKVWFFDRDKKKFMPHFDIHFEQNVKSVSIHPRTGQMVYVQAELPNWWSASLKFKRPERVIERGERMYKARWVR